MWSKAIDNKKAITYILLATFVFAIMNLMAKYLSHFHPLQVVFFRVLGSFIFILPYMLAKRISFLGNNSLLLFLRGLVGFISLATFFIVIQRIPLGSAISLRYVAPIFGAILAYFFLKERVSILQCIGFAIAFGGVIVLKGFDYRIDYWSFFLIMTSALFAGFVFVLVRYLAQREHHLTIINMFMMVALVGSLFFVSHFRMPAGIDWMYIAIIGVTGLLGQIFMTLAFKSGETTLLAPFKYMELVWALFFGLFLFNESYTFLAFLGIILIVLGMVVNVIGKQKN